MTYTTNSIQPEKQLKVPYSTNTSTKKDKHELSLKRDLFHTKDSRPSTYQIDDLLAYTLPETSNPNSSACKMDYLYAFENQGGSSKTGIQFFSRME